MQAHGCGLIYSDQVEDRIVFVHFRDIEPVDGWQGLEKGDVVEFEIDEEKARTFHRRVVASGEHLPEGGRGFVRRVNDASVLEQVV
ncbi:MAG: hypothetical protein D6771_05775, partial [Zetaproteobacteria bacterium]